MIPMKQTPLSQLAFVSAGQGAPKDNEFSESGVPFVRAGSLEALLSGRNESELELVSTETAKLRKLKIYPKGTILFAKSGMSATKDRVYVLQNPAHVVSHLATLIPKDGTHVDYLRLALKRFPPSSLIKDPAYPAIGLSEIENFEIPVPEEIDDQIRIAHLLGKVEGLIAQRKQHLQQHDDLLKSVFLEMFGDPVRNEKGWEIKEITDVCAEIVDCVNKTAPQVEEPTPFVMVRTSNIRGGKISLEKIKFVDAETYKIWTRRSKPRFGDILFTREAPMGEAGMIDFDDQIFLGQRIMQYRCNLNIANPKFILELMKTRFFQRQVEKLGKGSTVKHLAVPDCFKFKVIAPPIPVQNQFAAIVEKIEGIKSRYQQSLNDLEALYGTLSQKAFKGELDVSRVPMPAPAQSIAPVSIGDQAAVPEPVVQALPAIHLPDSGNLLAALESAEAREVLISQWLTTYRDQRGGMPFSVQHFIAAVETRLAELHPGNDFELGASDFDHIKAWVFESLAAGTLTQVFDDVGNCIQLKAVQA